MMDFILDFISTAVSQCHASGGETARPLIEGSLVGGWLEGLLY